MGLRLLLLFLIQVILSTSFFSSIAFADFSSSFDKPNLGLDGCDGRFASVANAAVLMSQYYKANIEDVSQTVGESFSAVSVAHLDARAKEAMSTAIKISVHFKKMEHEGLALKDDVAWSIVRDGIGLRVILSNTSQQNMARVRKAISDLINHHGMRLIRISNYHGDGIFPYAESTDIDSMVAESNAAEVIRYVGVAGITPDGANKPEVGQELKRSGYTTLQMNFVTAEGVIFELQIRGPIVHRIAEAEHLYYDVSSGKLISAAHFELKAVLDNMSQKQKQAYESYLNDCYKYARALEINPDTHMEEPILPITLRFLNGSDLLRLNFSPLDQNDFIEQQNQEAA